MRVRPAFGRGSWLINEKLELPQSLPEGIKAIDINTESKSKIRDVDIAVETSNLNRHNLRTSYGSSVLLQANRAPNQAIKLIQRTNMDSIILWIRVDRKLCLSKKLNI